MWQPPRSIILTWKAAHVTGGSSQDHDILFCGYLPSLSNSRSGTCSSFFWQFYRPLFQHLCCMRCNGRVWSRKTNNYLLFYLFRLPTVSSGWPSGLVIFIWEDHGKLSFTSPKLPVTNESQYHCYRAVTLFKSHCSQGKGLADDPLKVMNFTVLWHQ